MAEGNGEVSTSMDDVNKSADHRKLLEYGLDARVASKLDDIYKTGKLAHVDLDERALDALKEFPVEGALNVLAQFLESNLEHVSNKSAYLCGVMKTYRQKSRSGGAGSAAGGSQSGGGGSGSQSGAAGVQVKGPDEEKIKEILDRTGYTLDVTTGQRKYGGPPPGWDVGGCGVPGAGCEVFCGKIPKDMYEDELIPLFEQCGTIWDLRLMMDPMTGTNRGYAFVTFTTREAAQVAVQKLNDYEIRKGKRLGVTISYNNHRLFVGYIPKNRDRDDLMQEFTKHAPGLMEVIIYSSPDDKKKNRGFCFLEYESHKSASLAKRRLGTGRIKVWGCDIIVDWADPQEEPDEQTMSKVKVLYVRNLTQDITEERLKEQFEQYGKVERVKKIKDYAFVHFEDRDHAVKAMEELDGKEMGGSNIEVSLAKPPSDKKKKEEILRARERRMFQMLQVRGGMMPAAAIRGPPGQGGGPGGRQAGGGGMRGGPMGRGDYDYDYDYYGYYGDYRGGYSDPYYDENPYTAPPGGGGGGDDYYYDMPQMPPPPPPPMMMRGGGGGGGRSGRGGAPPPQSGGRGRGVVARGRAGGPPGRGATTNTITTRGRPGHHQQHSSLHQQQLHQQGPPGAAVGRGAAGHRAARGGGRAKPSLPGKRKFDGGHQNQGETKRRFQQQNNWGSQPLAQQPLQGSNNGGHEWYQDSSYPQWT